MTVLDVNQIAAMFHRDGFVIVRDVFSRQEIADLQRTIEAYIRDVVPRLGPGDAYFEDAPGRPVKSLFAMDEHSDAFLWIARDDRLLRVCRAIWPAGPVIHEPRSTMFFAKPAREGSVTPAHQDNAFQYWNPPDAATVTIGIDESTPENGALICARGSHRQMLPHRPSGVMGFSMTLTEPYDTDRFPEMQVCLKPGDICIHHIQVIHRSEPNRSDRPRRQLGIGFRSSLAQKDQAAAQRHQQLLAELHAAKAHAARS